MLKQLTLTKEWCLQTEHKHCFLTHFKAKATSDAKVASNNLKQFHNGTILEFVGCNTSDDTNSDKLVWFNDFRRNSAKLQRHYEFKKIRKSS